METELNKITILMKDKKLTYTLKLSYNIYLHEFTLSFKNSSLVGTKRTG